MILLIWNKIVQYNFSEYFFLLLFRIHCVLIIFQKFIKLSIFLKNVFTAFAKSLLMVTFFLAFQF